MLQTRLEGVLFVLLGLLLIVFERRYAADGRYGWNTAESRVNRVLIWVVGMWFVLGGPLMAITGRTEF